MRSSGNAGVLVHEGVKGKEQSAANRAARQSRYTETGEEPVGGRDLFIVLGRGEHRRSRRNDASEAKGGGRNRTESDHGVGKNGKKQV